MNPVPVATPMANAPSGPKLPWRFVVVTFVVAGVVGAAILYFGLSGQLGAGIP